jgi:hypothetical protein
LAEFAEVSLPPTRPDQPAAEAPATE